MSEHEGKTMAEIIHDYAVVRGDLCEQYARDQLVRIIEDREAALIERVRVAEDLAESRHDAMVAWRENAERKAVRAERAEAAVERVKALVQHAENTPTARFIHPSRLHAAITTPADTAEQRVRFTRYEASEKHGCIAETRTGASHCQTCTCGCTCGFGGLHDDANPRCELNPTTEPTEGDPT